MASTMLKFGILAASASQALASCAYGTLLHPRSPQGEVKVNTFGYMGANVSRIIYLPLVQLLINLAE